MAVTNEHMENTIQFILGQQAEFATDLQKVSETLAAQGQFLSKQNEAVITVLSVVNRMGEAQEKADGRIANLESRMTSLTETVDTLGERVDAFITFVEKYVASRNGGGERQSTP
jgi:polyhydroxyalkanoate synthesis regulator phasin